MMYMLCAALLLAWQTPEFQEQVEQKLAIERLLKAQVDCWNKGDLEGFMAFYWKSPHLSFVSGGDVTRGWEATLARYRKAYQAEGKEMGQLAFSDLEIHPLAADSAWLQGKWRLKLKGAEPGGRYTLILRKLPEGWRIVHDHTSKE